MKLLQALQWVIDNRDTAFEFVGELLTACWAFVVASRPLIKVLAKFADWTDKVQWDNKAVQAMSDFADALASFLDQARRAVPAPRQGLPAAIQPITSKETRAAASAPLTYRRMDDGTFVQVAPSVPPAPIPPLESKAPPAPTQIPSPITEKEPTP